MRAKPRNMNELLQHWVDRCEACHSEAIAITDYELHEPKRMGLLESFGYWFEPIDESAKRKFNRDLRRKREGEVWVEYHCKNCGGRFEKSTNAASFTTFMDMLKAQYEE